jgi:hypothetical protein
MIKDYMDGLLFFEDIGRHHALQERQYRTAGFDRRLAGELLAASSRMKVPSQRGDVIAAVSEIAFGPHAMRPKAKSA